MLKRMIATDLDSTLLRTDKTISDYSVSMFNTCREKGIMTVFATARPLSMTSVFTKKIHIDGLIATNGAFIYAANKLIYEYVLPVELSRKLLAELSVSPEIIRISARKREGYYTNIPMNETEVSYDFRIPLNEPIVHLSFRTDDTAYAVEIIRKYPELEIYHTSGENHYDVGAKGCNKANGVKKLAFEFGIHIDEIVAFGDDYNDIEMLRECGVGIAVSNAINEVKVAADYICDTNDNDGVAKWLEENLI